MLAGAIGWIGLSSDSSAVRVDHEKLRIQEVQQAVFRDLLPVRTLVAPVQTILIDAVEGGTVTEILARPGDLVELDQPMIRLGNTNLQLQVIQHEAALSQAMSQLQQNEIVLEQNRVTDERQLAEIDYNITRLRRSIGRRSTLAKAGAGSIEQMETVKDELDYYLRLRPIQADGNARRSELRVRILPQIRAQLETSRRNLEIVRAKLDNLIVKSPISGRVTQLDLKVGEIRTPGQRLAEVTPDAGFKLSAELDEFYLPRVSEGQKFGADDAGVAATISRIFPTVRDGRFTIELSIDTTTANLVAGQSLSGRLALGADTTALVIPSGPFLERTGGRWVFVVDKDGDSAKRRSIQVGRRTSEQIEILSGLNAGDQVITSDYTDIENANTLLIAR